MENKKMSLRKIYLKSTKNNKRLKLKKVSPKPVFNQSWVKRK